MTQTTVPLTMPLHVWGRLASVAERRGVTVSDLIAEAVAALVPDPPATPTPLYEEGYTGAPGHRLDVLGHELKAARRAGWRSADVKRSMKETA